MAVRSDLCKLAFAFKYVYICILWKSCVSESGPMGTDTVGEEAGAQSCFRGGTGWSSREICSHKCNQCECMSSQSGRRYIHINCIWGAICSRTYITSMNVCFPSQWRSLFPHVPFLPTKCIQCGKKPLLGWQSADTCYLANTASKAQQSGHLSSFLYYQWTIRAHILISPIFPTG